LSVAVNRFLFIVVVYYIVKIVIEIFWITMTAFWCNFRILL